MTLQTATKLAAWLLALYAVGYSGLLLLLLGQIVVVGGVPLLFLLPAGAAIAAIWRLGKVEAGVHRGADFLIALALAVAALGFGLITVVIGFEAPLRGAIGFIQLVGFLAMPTVLSGWMAVVYIRSGWRWFRPPPVVDAGVFE
ncbi:hypothetical protein AIOL_000332 [Candidatus Rhodobacter oscarellae]|uniref:Uncharacterized protein n=1 Tax=Candidatus Rhodobacter oscarellae TaxID=1675527 RepID=A0A0J9EER5_9RHOB|nr:hypothetical protein [Candidatus Rhodobacter lobularis]KMW60179.1 hypothetical protein AIOL_000332 [Candidatus Rhodobacter lobularis]